MCSHANTLKLFLWKTMQGECVMWHEEHYCRLTVSNVGRVVKQKSGFRNLAFELLSNKNLSNIPAIKWKKIMNY